MLTKLKNTLLRRIGTALSSELRDDHSTFELPCGWVNIRQDFLALTHHIETDQKHAEDLVKELHEEIIGQIRSEMETAWMVVEDLTRDRHFEHVLRSNQDLDRLSKLLEPIVIKDLNIQIEPADVKLKPVSSLAFQRDISELLVSAINEQTIERNNIYRYVWGARYTAYLFDGGSIREFFENIIREITDEAIQQVQASVHRHVSGQIASSEEKVRAFGEIFKQGIESAIEARLLSINTSATSMQRVIEDIDMLKKLKNLAGSLRRRLETGLEKGKMSEIEPQEPQPDLEIRVQHPKEEIEGTNDQGRYVPPRLRSDMAPTPKLNAGDRTDSFAFSDLSETMIESPKSAQHNRSNGGDNWRIARSSSWGWNSWAAQATPPHSRSQWAQTPPVPPREGQTNAAAGDNFSPRSNFFRNFQQTPRASRGRGSEHPHRSGSWQG